MIPNPQMILAAVVAVGLAAAGGYFYGRHDGAKLERLAWEQRDNTALREANVALDTMHREVVRKEREAAEAMAALAGLYAEETEHVEVERDRALDAVRRGELRLRTHAAAADSTCRLRVSQASAGAAASAEAATEERLHRERSEAAIRLLAEADELAGEVNYCWAVVRKDRGLD